MKKTHIKFAIPALALIVSASTVTPALAQVGVNVNANVQVGADARVPAGKTEVKQEARLAATTTAGAKANMATSSRPIDDEKPVKEERESKAKNTVFGTVLSIGGGEVVIGDANSTSTARTFVVASTTFYAATGTAVIAGADLKVGDSVRAVDAKLAANVGAKGVFGRIWGMFRSLFGGSNNE